MTLWQYTHPLTTLSLRNNCEFLSFSKIIGKKLNDNYSQKLLDTAKTSVTDALKTALKTSIQTRGEATGDLIGNKLSAKIPNTSSQNASKTNNTPQTEDVIPMELFISTEKRQQTIDELKLIQYINKMEYQKLINLLDNEATQPFKVRTRNWLEINDD